MSDTIIEVQNLSKRYQIGEKVPYKALRDEIAKLVAAPFRKLKNSSDARKQNEYIWALKDVSFTVKRGEIVGIIGRNGAGKTTLLKVLSRITEPTSGQAIMRGRVSSLLEVGTGFHPELTGRENIYLNGAILGMRKSEIDRKFDEIVAFAEVEKFIDTPVKRYSSGMYVRLAFAVAAHLEPEILLVDEVLAVGDFAFQKKCLGKMGDVAKEGRTVLFVSHNMAATQNLCQRAILLDLGRIKMEGKVMDVVNKYVSSLEKTVHSASLKSRSNREGSGVLRFIGFTINTPVRSELAIICTGEQVELIAEYESLDGQPLRNVSVSIPFYNYLGQHMFMCWTRVVGLDYEEIPPRGRFIAKICQFPLPEGKYYINLWCEVNGVLADWVESALSISVVAGDFFDTGKVTPKGHGGVLVKHTWNFEKA